MEILTDEEILAIQSVINPHSVIGARLQAIFLLMIDTGIRASELCTLKYDSVDIAQGSAKVVGKGNKERIVFFNNGVKKALLNYDSTVRPKTECPCFFTTENGEPLTYNALKLIFVRLAQRSGVARLHPHLLRHTFSVNYLISSKGDVFGLQRMLGHCDVSTTTLYLHMSQQYEKSQSQSFSLVDRLGLGSKKGRKKAA